MEQSITFKNVDCTIEGGQFDFCAAGIESPDQAVAKPVVKMLLMGLRRQGGLINYFAFQRSGAQVKRIRG